MISPHPLPPVGVHVLSGIPAAQSHAAAGFYWHHFGAQILPWPVDAHRGTALVAACLCPEHALIALSPEGAVIGILGLRGVAGGLLSPDRAGFVAALGAVRGRLCHLGTALHRRGGDTTDLVIDGLAVAPDWRRQGVARALVRVAADHARTLGHPALRAQVHASNAPALRAWQAMGFQSIGRQGLGWPWAGRAHVLRLLL